MHTFKGVKTIHTTAILLLALTVSGCQLLQSSEGWRVAMRAPRNTHDSDAYARELQQSLTQSGVQAKLVRFRCTVVFREGAATLPAQSGVVYRNDKTPRFPWWYMDAKLTRPVWLPNVPLADQIRYAKQTEVEILPGPEPAAPPTAREPAESDDWRKLFRRANGSSFNPASSLDRQKMAELKAHHRA